MKKEIKICDNCGTPLIWTFRWSYNECYCLNCRALGDMFLGKNTELTSELKLKNRVVKKIWRALYGKNAPLLPISEGYRKDKCKKCDEGQDHSEHLTEKEIREGRVAQRILDKMSGIFN